MSANKKVQIKSTKEHRKNKSILVGDGVGEVKFDGKCIAEVTQEDWEKMKSMGVANIALVEKPSNPEKKTSTTNSAPNAKETSPGEDGKEEGSEEQEDFEVTKSQLDGMKVAELQTAAQNAELPEEEWADLKKPQLVDYLFEKMNDQVPEDGKEEGSEE